MQQEVVTWNDYKAHVREFDAVLEHAKAVAALLVAESAASRPVHLGEQIFIKLLSHCVVLRGLAADPNGRSPAEPWNLPSLCAMARCAVEAHDAFEYVAGHEMTDSERGFRLMLWGLHDKARRLKMPGDTDPADPQVAGIRASIARQQADLVGHAFFAGLAPELQAELRRRMDKGDPPAFHLSQRQRCALSGVNADWYQAVTMLLSQYVHTLPSTVHQLAASRPGTPETLGLMTLPIVITLPFLARVTERMAGRPPQPPSRTARTMAKWRLMAERGEITPAP